MGTFTLKRGPLQTNIFRHMYEHVCKRTQVLTHEISTNSCSQTYLHDEENRVWRFLEENTEHASVTEAIALKQLSAANE